MEQFLWAVKTGDLKNVKDAVEGQGVSATSADASVRKATPLHYAADFGQVEVAEYLLSKGANLDAQDAFGVTPLLAAVYEDHVDMVKFLVSKGANKTTKGSDGKTAKESTSNPDIVALL
jgi:ankyrin repeat protein